MQNTKCSEKVMINIIIIMIMTTQALALSKKGKRLGDDLNGGPILTAHWSQGRGVAVGGVIKNPAGGIC